MTSRTVRVNGAQRIVLAGTRLVAVVGGLAPDASEGLAVAVNGEIVPRSRWHEREVQEGDDIEIVRAVQGG